mgnify:CR=1 FL=1
MKAIILAGGFGTRLGSITETIPKPMIEIDNKPLLYHIMSSFSNYGINDFILALGYKSEIIKNYFLNFKSINSDFEIDLESGNKEYFNSNPPKWRVSLIDTGLNTMTGGRLKRLSNYIKDDTFLLTYGDGLSNVNLRDLIDFHKSHGKMVTVTAVRPNARFGELRIDNNIVKSFKEKPRTLKGRINGGYFVINKEFIDLIDNDSTILEIDPLEKAASLNELMAFKHDDFWQCVDTPRDKYFLDSLVKKNKIYPWLK